MLIDLTVPELTVSMIYFFSYWVTTAYSSWYVSMILAADLKHVRSSKNQLTIYKTPFVCLFPLFYYAIRYMGFKGKREICLNN